MRLASINIYVGNKQLQKDVALIKTLDLDVAGYQEAHNAADELAKGLPFNDILWDDKTKSSREVLVSLNLRRNRLVGVTGREVSSVSPKEETKVFKPRSINVVKFINKNDGHKYALLNYHGNAAVQDRETGVLLKAKRVVQWVRAAGIIQRRIKQLQKAGYRVLVTGDFNYRRFPRYSKFVLDYWSPQRIFRRRGLEWVEHGLDYIAWPEKMREVKTVTVPTSQHGGDHDWVVVHLA